MDDKSFKALRFERVRISEEQLLNLNRKERRTASGKLLVAEARLKDAYAKIEALENQIKELSNG